MGVNHQKSADRLARKASENAREEFDVNIQITMACTRAAQQGHISYNMRAHILGAIHGDGTPAAVEEWQLRGGGPGKSEGNPHTANDREIDLY